MIRSISAGDATLGAAALACAALGWVAALGQDRGVHGLIAAGCFTVAAAAVIMRRRALWRSAGCTAAAFAVLAASGSADALGVFPLIVCVPLTVSAVTGYGEHRWQGIVATAVAVAATPLSPAFTISESPVFAFGLHAAVLIAVHLWSSRRRLQRDASAAERVRDIAEAQSAERQRIAADLHDGLGHALTAIRAKSATAAALAVEHPERAFDALAVISELSRESLVDLRRTIGEIARTGGDDVVDHGEAEIGGSLPAMIDRVRQLDRDVHCDLPPNTTLDGIDARMAESTRSAVRRAVQESITNLMRHTPSATGLAVSIETEPGTRSTPARAILTLSNPRDGDSDTDAHHDGAGRGCAIMLERIADVGGHATAGPVGDDWVVALRVPLLGEQAR